MQATLDGEVAYQDAELVIVSTPTNYDPEFTFLIPVLWKRWWRQYGG